MSWHTQQFVAFDIESTGVDVETDRIVTATIVWIGGSVVEPREWLINPGVEIPQAAIDVHGVTNERAMLEGADPAEALNAIHAELMLAWQAGGPVVIYNAPFDLSILDRELRRHCGLSLDGLIGPVVDPFVIDKHKDPYRKGKRTLTATSEHYQVRLDGAHTSNGDAMAAARLAWRLAEVYPDDLADLDEINAKQAAWRAQWAKEFEDYLTRKGTPEPVDGHWPLRPLSVSA